MESSWINWCRQFIYCLVLAEILNGFTLFQQLEVHIVMEFWLEETKDHNSDIFFCFSQHHGYGLDYDWTPCFNTWSLASSTILGDCGSFKRWCGAEGKVGCWGTGLGVYSSASFPVPSLFPDLPPSTSWRSYRMLLSPCLLCQEGLYPLKLGVKKSLP